MKKLLLLSICVAVLWACKKDHNVQSESNSQKTEVKFTVGDFNPSQSTLGKANASISEVGDTLKNYAEFFYYRVYDASGALVKTKSQTSTQSDFGTVKDTLAQGNYTVIFAASKKALKFAGTSLENDYFANADTTSWEDTFFKKLNLNVGASPISQGIRLERIVAGLQLNLQKDLPEQICTINIIVEDDDSQFKLNSGTSATPVRISKSFDGPCGNPNEKEFLFMHLLNTSRPKKITITAYGWTSDLIINKVINNVNFFPNKKTVLTGDISSDVTIGIKVDPVWGIVNEPVRF